MEIKPVDYANPDQAQDLIQLLDHYARDPMGGGEALPESTKAVLASEMAKREGVFSFIVYEGDQPIGLVNCVVGFSTFAAKPVCNIHDIAVVDGHRGKGIAQKLLQAVKQEAQRRGCCKLTLEVLGGNEPGKLAYAKFGFAPYELDPEKGKAEFWECKI